MKTFITGFAFCLLAGIDPDKTDMVPLLITMGVCGVVFWWGMRGVKV